MAYFLVNQQVPGHKTPGKTKFWGNHRPAEASVIPHVWKWSGNSKPSLTNYSPAETVLILLLLDDTHTLQTCMLAWLIIVDFTVWLWSEAESHSLLHRCRCTLGDWKNIWRKLLTVSTVKRSTILSWCTVCKINYYSCFSLPYGDEMFKLLYLQTLFQDQWWIACKKGRQLVFKNMPMLQFFVCKAALEMSWFFKVLNASSATICIVHDLYID